MYFCWRSNGRHEDQVAVKTTYPCFRVRVAMADLHMGQGEWACGLVTAKRLQRCAEQKGCEFAEACARAARELLEQVRHLVADEHGTVPPPERKRAEAS